MRPICVHLDLSTGRGQCLLGKYGGFPSPGVCQLCEHHADRPSPLAERDWPIWVKLVALKKSDEDNGVGDTVARVIGPAHSQAFRDWFKNVFKRDCDCELRMRQWNSMFPYSWQPYKKMAEGVFVINLDRRADRLREFKDGYATIGSPFGEVERFAAIEGASLPPPPTGWPDGVGAWGCLHSHIAVLREATRRGLKSVLVLEDDALFMSRKKIQALDRVPRDWQGIFLGGAHGQDQLVAEGVIQCSHTFCMHAYFVRGELLHALAEEMEKRYAPCDACFVAIQPQWKVYGLSPSAVGQTHSESDLTGTTRPRRVYN